MADSCDFDGKAYKNVSASSGKECAQLCRRKKGCTHFTYTVGNILLPFVLFETVCHNKIMWQFGHFCHFWPFLELDENSFF
jgi:hypothetical protein